MSAQPIETKSRLLAKLLREVLDAGPYTSVADVADALKTRCARLRISYTPDELTDAYRLVESNTPLCGYVRPSAPTPPAGDRVVSADEVAANINQIRRRLGVELAPKAMPAVRPLTDDELGARRHRDDQRRAYLQVKRLIVETAKRGRRLEDEIAGAS